MKGRWIGRVVILGFATVCGLTLQARADATSCRMKFSLQGWSAFYKSASGHATITCDNGQSAHVSIHAKGGGLTVGMTKVVDGTGRFTPVGDISEVFGTYGAAEAHAGMGASSDAQVVTKGSVSLALSGMGEGVNLGVSFGKFVIKKAHAGHTQRNGR